ncbi:MAG TPA: hypothetical protein VEY67_09700 [Candidatus Dormibacteraeota bacterium]|nr:hypothetical protein [Candidatus Dormibacteraeota bacterium]
MAAPVRFRPDVPGAPEIEVVPDPIRGPRVRADGRKLTAGHGPGGLSFAVPMADGSTRPLRLKGGFLDLTATFEGADHTIQPRLRLWETFLVVLPLAILALGAEAPSLAGTLLAALVSAVAVGLALVAVRAARPAWLRAIAALGTTVVGYVVAGVLVASV